MFLRFACVKHMCTMPFTTQSHGSIAAIRLAVTLQVKCKVGDIISKGQILLVLEAMKMEHPITASIAGRVRHKLPHLQICCKALFLLQGSMGARCMLLTEDA